MQIRDVLFARGWCLVRVKAQSWHVPLRLDLKRFPCLWIKNHLKQKKRKRQRQTQGQHKVQWNKESGWKETSVDHHHVVSSSTVFSSCSLFPSNGDHDHHDDEDKRRGRKRQWEEKEEEEEWSAGQMTIRYGKREHKTANYYVPSSPSTVIPRESSCIMTITAYVSSPLTKHSGNDRRQRRKRWATVRVMNMKQNSQIRNC